MSQDKTKQPREATHNPIDPDKVAENPHLLPYAHTVGGAVINFNLIALPMSEMVGGGSYIGGWKSTVYLKCTDRAVYFIGPQVHHIMTRGDVTLACALGTQFGQDLVPIVQCREE